jgi:hypothetical protein
MLRAPRTGPQRGALRQDMGGTAAGVSTTIDGWPPRPPPCGLPRPQQPHPILEHRHRPLPADTLGDHRRGHVRELLQQRPDRGSTASTIDPLHARPYLGGSSAANARLTVFFEIPIRRAIALIGIPSARCNRRTSAQSSTLITLHSDSRGGQSPPDAWGSVQFSRDVGKGRLEGARRPTSVALMRLLPAAWLARAPRRLSDRHTGRADPGRPISRSSRSGAVTNTHGQYPVS